MKQIFLTIVFCLSIMAIGVAQSNSIVHLSNLDISESVNEHGQLNGLFFRVVISKPENLQMIRINSTSLDEDNETERTEPTVFELPVLSDKKGVYVEGSEGCRFYVKNNIVEMNFTFEPRATEGRREYVLTGVDSSNQLTNSLTGTNFN